MSVELALPPEEILAEEDLFFYQDKKTRRIKILNGRQKDTENAPITFWVRNDTLFLKINESFNELRKNHRAIVVMDYIARMTQDCCRRTNLDIDNKVLPDLKVVIMVNLPFEPFSSIHSS